MGIFSTLSDPWQFEFFRRALLAATMVGALTGLVGVLVVLRRMSYIGHGMSHAVFGGAVVGYVAGINFYLAAGVWGFASALLINQATRRRQIGADAAIGIVTTASFAIGVALISRAKSVTRNFDAALFGNLLGISGVDLAVIAGVLVFAALVFVFAYKRLLFMVFDPEVAPAFGVRTGRLDALVALMLAATIIASIRIMGVTLIAASIVIPPVTARLLTDRFSIMLALSAAIGGAVAFAGIYASYYVDIASGASIVLLSTAVFAVTLLTVVVRQWRRTGRPGLEVLDAPTSEALLG
ncbi:MAG: metal ABC transporter permease [Dehalococcoidia bacterium]|nr:MAG: metal ABC transporter permease [Dehalococcoidia bacterium]